MKKRVAASMVALATVVLIGAFATTAQAFPTKTSACTDCHSKNTAVKVTATQTANDGTTATYDVSVTGPNPILGWAVLSGSTNIANATAGTGTFKVPVGKTYTVWGVSKTSSAMAGSNSIAISPTAPVVNPPEPTTTPVPTTTPEPTTTPVPTATVGVGTCTFKLHVEHRSGVVAKLTNVDTGATLTTQINKRGNAVFADVPDGTYKLTYKRPHHKTKVVGTYTITSGVASKIKPVDHGEDD